MDPKKNIESYEKARELRNQYEEEYINAAKNLMEVEETYQAAFKAFKETQKKYDAQACLVQRWYNDLLYAKQRLETLLK